jgi:pilus assembly protein CpaE
MTPATILRTLYVLDDGVESSAVEHVLPTGHPIQAVGIVEGVDAAWRALEEASPDVLVVVAARPSDRALALIESAAKVRPDRPIVVLYQGPPDEFMRRAFESGADDLVTLPESSEAIRFSLQKAVARRRGSLEAGGQGPMICILGPKGGTGKTLTSCNLGVAFAQAGKRSVIVDLDLQFGDVGIALGLSPEKTIYDLVRSGGSLDVEKVDSFLVRHDSGADALLAPTRPDQAGLIGVEFVREVLKSLRSSHEVVIVDTPPAFSPEVIAAIDAASHLCLVSALDALSLKDSKLGLETLELMGHRGSKVRVLLNRADAGGGITRQDVESILGRKPDVFVPEDRDIVRFVAEGRPIVVANERAVAARAFTGLAKEYIDDFEAAERALEMTSPNGHKPRRSLAGVLLGRGA